MGIALPSTLPPLRPPPCPPRRTDLVVRSGLGDDQRAGPAPAPGRAARRSQRAGASRATLRVWQATPRPPPYHGRASSWRTASSSPCSGTVRTPQPTLPSASHRVTHDMHPPHLPAGLDVVQQLLGERSGVMGEGLPDPSYHIIHHAIARLIIVPSCQARGWCCARRCRSPSRSGEPH